MLSRVALFERVTRLLVLLLLLFSIVKNIIIFWRGPNFLGPNLQQWKSGKMDPGAQITTFLIGPHTLVG